DTVPGPHVASSDIYFVQVRPFKKDYKQAQSQAQQGGGGAQQADVGELSRQQREIVAATFNTVRDKAKTKPDKYRENVVFLNLAQAKLRAQVEELADMFELELDKLANQYEMKQQAEQQASDKQIDQLAEKLKELARRQQQEAERQRRLSQAGSQQQQQSGSSGGGGGQRQLAQEAEDAARRLEQLSREQKRPDLADAARQLQDAAN